MKRLLTLFAAAVLGVSAFAGDSSSWKDADGITWNFSYTDSDYTAIITGASGYKDEIRVPGTVLDGGTLYTVVEIGDSAFDADSDGNVHSIKSVVLPDTVLSIGQYAFYDCSSLEKVVLGNPEIIKDYAFMYCSDLSYVDYGAANPSDIEMQPLNAFIGTP